MKGMMKVLGVIILAIIMFGLDVESTLAQTSSTAPYSGDLWNRSTLTGDWFGVRNDLAAKGITFDMSLTQVGQGVVDGGKDEGWKYGGRGNLTFNLDTEKLGLWPGGFLTVEVEGNFTDSVNGKTGALMPVNSNQLYPTPSGDNLNVPQVSFMQFFSPYAGVVLGKLDTTSGDANEFAHGKGDTQFLNLAFNFNPTAVVAAPYSGLGAGLIILPTKDPKAAIINFMVLQTNGKASTTGFSDLHSNQLSFAGEARVRTDFFGLTGHQLIGGGSIRTKRSLPSIRACAFSWRTVILKKRMAPGPFTITSISTCMNRKRAPAKASVSLGGSGLQMAIPIPCTSSSALEPAARVSFPVGPSISLGSGTTTSMSKALRSPVSWVEPGNF